MNLREISLDFKKKPGHGISITFNLTKFIVINIKNPAEIA